MGSRQFVPDLSITVAQFPPGTFVGAGGTNLVTALNNLATAAGGYQGLPADQQFNPDNGPYKIQFMPEGGAMRITDNGIILTATLGFPIAAGAMFTYDGNKLAALKLLEQAAATLNVWIARLRA